VPVISSIDDELNQFERDIRQLKIEYDQYFGGGRKRPPTEIEWRLDMVAKRYAERGGELKFGQRFRYNNLTQTYAKYKDIFRKRLQQKEEGKVQRHFGAAAKKIETERAQKQAEMDAANAAVEAGAAAAATAAAATAATAAAATASTSGTPSTFRMVCSKPEQESEKIAELYEAFLQAKKNAGEATEKLTRSSFNEFVLKKTKDLQKQKNCQAVEYVVEVVEGQVKLKALVKS
jgi:hypothetical protein